MSGINAATRPTRRDLKLHPWRTLAAVMLIALPVALVIGIALFDNSSGRLSAALSSPDRSLQVSNERQDIANEDVPRLAAQVLPKGLSVSPVTTFSSTSLIHNGKSTNSWVDQFDTENPPEPAQEAVDKFNLGPNQAVLSRSTARKIDASVGDVITVRTNALSGDRQATVAAIAPENYDFVTSPTLNDAHGDPSFQIRTSWVIVGDTPLTKEDADRAHEAGLEIWAPELRDTDRPDSESDSFGGILSSILFVLFFFGLYAIAGLLILFLLAPVFTLATGRNTRLYALMSSQGALPRHIMFAVMAYGLLMGLIGATIGVIVGLTVSWVWWTARYPDFAARLPFLAIALAWLVAVAGCVIVSIVPAWLAQRGALSAAIQGAAPDRLLRFRKWMAIGPAFLLLLVLFSFTPWGEYIPTVLALFGVIAVAASAPALVFLCSLLSRRGPLALRLAGRGLTRRSMHALPTSIALVSVSFTASLFGVGVMTDSAKSVAEEALVMPETTALIEETTFDQPTQVSTPEERAAVEAIQQATGARTHSFYAFPSWTTSFSLPDDGEFYELSTEFDYQCEQVDLSKPVERAVFVDNQGRRTDESEEARQECAHELMTTFPYSPLIYQSRMIQADSSQLELWQFDSEEDRRAAAQTLEAGGIVLPHSSHVGDKTHGTVTVKTYNRVDSQEPSGAHNADLPVVEALPTVDRDVVLISQQAAQKLNMKPFYVGQALALDEAPSEAEREELRDLTASASQSRYSLEFGVSSPESFRYYLGLGMGIICLIVLALIIANAANTMRHESTVLQSIGAHPSLMSKVAAWQTWIVATASMLFGVIAGHLGTFLFTDRSAFTFSEPPHGLRPQDYFTPDWWQFLAVLVVPLIAAAIAAAVNRSDKTAPLTARDRSESRSLT
ncbi:FtsX-like permease family protein [Corynebacterium guaraldiae]|uniref:FtsX-like permease family protein n=1 Tax=Corynebacterium hesseae TaxID=2913502 RepID=A0ABU9UID3_9CORY|nr:FtsX-like permease family protein [Corynebacterium sp. HMSC055A01]OFN15625.1 ABC transporter permease [Corynebacterium sp. HMSC055A01]PKZ24763.1 ABC transporter permease [Corynebacterium aurimucosum]